MIKEDEFNSHLSETTNDKVTSTTYSPSEFDNKSVFDTNPSSPDELREWKKEKENKMKKAKETATIIALVVGGGTIIGLPSIIENAENKTTIEIIEYGERFVFFEFETEFTDLTAKIYNDFETIPITFNYTDLPGMSDLDSENQPTTFEAGDSSISEDTLEQEITLYHGVGFCEELSPNTNYIISLEGEQILGNSSRAKKEFKTLSESYEPPVDPPVDPSSSSSSSSEPPPSSSSSSSSSEDPYNNEWINWVNVDYSYQSIFDNIITYNINLGNVLPEISALSFELKATVYNPNTSVDENISETIDADPSLGTYEVDFSKFRDAHYLNIIVKATNNNHVEIIDNHQFDLYSLIPTDPHYIDVAIDDSKLLEQNILMFDLYYQDEIGYYTKDNFEAYLLDEQGNRVVEAEIQDDPRNGNKLYVGQFMDRHTMTLEVYYVSSSTTNPLRIYSDEVILRDTSTLEEVRNSISYYTEQIESDRQLFLIISIFDFDDDYGDVYVDFYVDGMITSDRDGPFDINNGEVMIGMDVSNYMNYQEIKVTVYVEYLNELTELNVQTINLHPNYNGTYGG